MFFMLSDNCEPTTELAIIDLVRYALEHADRNLPRKSPPRIRISKARACNNHKVSIFFISLAYIPRLLCVFAL